ncbi:MAG: CoA transferase [Chloroflexi bacterium]|nr:CoA transferase [Chloroflexota bacterium]
MTGPLHGLLVLDLSWILSGPFCTMVLSDLGARVIKVERPQGGDMARGNGPFIEGESSYFLSINRGKESVTLNLATSEGRQLFLRLVERADVVVENFVPGTMRRLGLDYETLRQCNARIVYCAVSGFGQTGPYAQRPALDVIVQGMGGIMSITGEGPGRPPVRPGASLGDIAAGLFAAIGILSALRERDRSGQGQMVDIGMLDCQVAIQENAFARYFATGEVPQPLGTRHPVFTPFQAFQTRDGWIVVAIVGGVNDQWPLFCATIGRIDLIDDERFKTGYSRTLNYSVLEPVLNEALRQRTTEEWLDEFSQAGIPCGPVNTIDQVARDTHVAARDMLVEVPLKEGSPQKARVVSTPVKLSRTQPAVVRGCPALGGHTESVLGEFLGVTPGDVRALREKGVV